MSNHEESIIQIQVRIAELEHVVDELSDALHSQWSEIDRLKMINARLSDRLQQVEQRVPDTPENEPLPPHY